MSDTRKQKCSLRLAKELESWFGANPISRKIREEVRRTDKKKRDQFRHGRRNP